jgi:hypothetical protein
MDRFSKMFLALTAGALVTFVAASPASAAPAGNPNANGAATGTSSTAHPAPAVSQKAPPAAKTTRPGAARTQHLDGFCNAYADRTGDLCLWYFQNYQGSYVDFYSNDSNLNDNVFLSPGTGQGANAANNSESDWNYDSTYTAWVCTEINYGGLCGPIPPNSGGNFNDSYRNNVASLYWTL